MVQLLVNNLLPLAVAITIHDKGDRYKERGCEVSPYHVISHSESSDITYYLQVGMQVSSHF